MSEMPATESLIDRFVRLLTVERLEEDYFRGIAAPGARGHLFGGQIIGQGLMAAAQTVAPERVAHSLHAYFIRAGVAEKPILYNISRDRDGGSFSTRRVVAIQEGKPILTMSASFQIREKGLSYTAEMPDVPGPEEFKNEIELNEFYADKLPVRLRTYLAENRPVELRPTIVRAPYVHKPMEPQFAVWIRAKGPMPDDPQLHRSGIAFASDMQFMGTALMPHGRGFADPDMRCASLDHSVWLHEDARLDDWLLYVSDSNWSGASRGLSHGKVFTRDGKLVAQTAQEGLMRQIGSKDGKSR
ncbi:acyl-CoA thioesterase [Chachezhania antarctica]|uniref:acyl-CoA thioesterase n=1 Tax=Chachezhania antarctica TaxID=2340860 RepID=UPI001F097583|nr:acyl-CoA thioesterase II [Chachezhania antarctica]|tara:strand:- start:4066 stop:4965 length:900 start_codon:yes stop_codon:yes gene_type:complete